MKEKRAKTNEPCAQVSEFVKETQRDQEARQKEIPVSQSEFHRKQGSHPEMKQIHGAGDPAQKSSEECEPEGYL